MITLINRFVFKNETQAQEAFKLTLREACYVNDPEAIIFYSSNDTDMLFTDGLSNKVITCIRELYQCKVELHVVSINDTYVDMLQRALMNGFKSKLSSARERLPAYE